MRQADFSDFTADGAVQPDQEALMVACPKFPRNSPTHPRFEVDGGTGVHVLGTDRFDSRGAMEGAMQVLRLGEVLVARGVLTRDQVDRIVEHQSRTARPFGALAEELFGVSPEAIESAWAAQYEAMSPALEIGSGEPTLKAIAAVTKRRARQFHVAPIRLENGHLVLATTRENLPRALRFVLRVLDLPCTFVVGAPEQIEALLSQCYADHTIEAA